MELTITSTKVFNRESFNAHGLSVWEDKQNSMLLLLLLILLLLLLLLLLLYVRFVQPPSLGKSIIIRDPSSIPACPWPVSVGG